MQDTNHDNEKWILSGSCSGSDQIGCQVEVMSFHDFDCQFPFLDGDVPRSTSYRVYISQLICFARASSHVADFNTRNKLLTQKLLKHDYRYHKLRKTFSKFFRRYYDLISKFQIGLTRTFGT